MAQRVKIRILKECFYSLKQRSMKQGSLKLLLRQITNKRCIKSKAAYFKALLTFAKHKLKLRIAERRMLVSRSKNIKRFTFKLLMNKFKSLMERKLREETFMSEKDDQEVAEMA